MSGGPGWQLGPSRADLASLGHPWQVLEYCASLGEIYDIVVEDMERQSRGLPG